MVTGFVYVGDDGRPGPMTGAAVGARVAVPPPGPPWIVVDHALDRVIVARWPGRLFRVGAVPPSTEEERAATARAGENLRDDAGYTRVLAVDVLEEIPPAALFRRPCVRQRCGGTG